MRAVWVIVFAEGFIIGNLLYRIHVVACFLYCHSSIIKLPNRRVPAIILPPEAPEIEGWVLFNVNRFGLSVI